MIPCEDPAMHTVALGFGLGFLVAIPGVLRPAR
jgi:hypothetical protein